MGVVPQAQLQPPGSRHPHPRPSPQGGGEKGLDFIPTLCYQPATPPLRGPARDGELRMGWRAGLRVRFNVSRAPGGGRRDPEALGPPRRKAVTGSPRATNKCSPSCEEVLPDRGRCSALHRQPHKLAHAAPGSARASHFFREGQTQPSPQDAACATVCFAVQKDLFLPLRNTNLPFWRGHLQFCHIRPSRAGHDRTEV